MTRTRRARWTAAVLAATAATATPAEPENLILLVRDAPAHGVVLGRIRIPLDAGEQCAATAVVDGKRIDAQLIPPIDAAGAGGESLIVLKLPGAGDHRVRLGFSRRADKLPDTQPVHIRGKSASFSHAAGKDGGLLGSIRFGGCKKTFDSFVWNDRVHDPKLGGFLLRHDADAKVDCVAGGPICTVVRVRGRYAKPNGDRPASRPEAVYDWVYFHDLPLVLVRARVTQTAAFPWRELHFLELNYPDRSFPAWAGGEPATTGTFSASKKGFGFDDWAMLRDGRAAVAMLRAGRMLFHDGRGAYGTYLHAHATQAWGGWKETHQIFSAWLWVGEADDPVAEGRRAATALPTDARVVVTLGDLRAEIESARREAAALKDADRRRLRTYEIAMAEKLEAGGEWALARTWLAGRAATGWARLVAGDLAVTFQQVKEGLRCRSLLDLATGTELGGPEPAPLFAVTLRHVKTGELRHLRADTGWSDVNVRGADGRTTLAWARPVDPALARVRVSATAAADAKRSRLSWTLDIVNPHGDWGVWRVVFPRVSLGDFARDVRVLVPQAAGVVKKDVWRDPVR
ncbi:MAG: hypothetical protein WBF17_05220, partial [Phycisphaerae bacterium]